MKLKIAGGFVAILAVALTAFYLINAPNPLAVSYPSPNGFDSVIEAGERMTPLPMDFDTSQDLDALNAYLDANRDPLSLLDQAADQQFLVRIGESEDMNQILEKTGAIRNASRLLYTRARVEDLEGRPEDAAETMAKIAIIGRRSAEGGLMVHRLMAVAIEHSGLEGLAQIEPKLTADLKNEIAKRIEAEDAGEVDLERQLDVVRTREHDNVKRQQGTLAGTFLIWQIGDSDFSQQPYDQLRDRLEEMKSTRKSLVEQLTAAGP